MKKEKKQTQRAKRWAKRTCIKEKQYSFLLLEMKKLGYNTVAGTLDYIINKYKK